MVRDPSNGLRALLGGRGEPPASGNREGTVVAATSEELGATKMTPFDEPASADRFRTLVLDRLQFVARNLRRLGVSEADVEDATQEVFLTVSRKLAQIAPEKERSFLYGVVLRVASHVRRAQARRGRATMALSNEPLPRSSDPEQAIHEAQARLVLDRALDAMSDELRSAFCLYELEEMTAHEISGLLGVPLGTIKSRLRRAREIFLSAIERERDGGGTSS